MIIFKASPKKDYPILKYVILLCGALGGVASIAGIYDSIVNTESILGIIVMTTFLFMFIFGVMVFWNYQIAFTEHKIIVTNWVGRKRSIKLDDLSQEIKVYDYMNQMYVVFYGHEDKKIIKTKYGKQAYLDFLRQEGFVQVNKKI